MEYYTYYELEIVTDEIDGDNMIADLRESVGDAELAINCSGNSNSSCKWYEHDEDMKTLSLKYPDVVFLLSGVGEENNDMWKKYYKNGKVQIEKAQITFNNFDEKKLV